MKSIRRTLLFNVLLLLVVALGLVSFFVYRTAKSALRERQRTAHELVEVRYAELLDDELRNRADELAGDVQSNWNRDKYREQSIANQWVVLATPISITSHVLATTRTLLWINAPLSFELNVRLSTELRLNEEEIYRDPAFAAHEYVQLTSDGALPWTSHSLSGHLLSLDEVATRADSDAHVTRFDTLEMPNGTIVRRVIMKAPVTKFRRVGGWPRMDSPAPSRAVVGVAAAARYPDRRTSPVFGPTPGGSVLPSFYLHCAWDISPNNPRLAPLLQDRDQQLAEIDAKTEVAVRSLRSTLGWTVGGALAATLLGVWVTVGLGLFPLRRLSVAVSQISPKDFRLPIAPNSLPAEIHPVAARLSTALTQLQAAFEREKRAAADISHELRTPLAALTTTIEVACRKVRTAEQYRDTLEECRGIAKQMSQLVERMLLLAWIDAGADQIRSEEIEVADLVGGLAAIGKPLAENRGLTFRTSVPRPITLRTDPDKLREVVMNLIHNAIEYNRPGGSVDVTAEATDRGAVALVVRDTGIGIAPEIQAKIFERFFRGDPSRNAAGVHAGLGLAIVKEYVDRLGGKLTVDSVVGEGSRFCVELPNLH